MTGLMLSQPPERLLSRPLSGAFARESVYKQFLAYLQGSRVNLKYIPSFLHAVDSFVAANNGGSAVNPARRDAQFSSIVTRFEQEKPECVLFFGVEQDYGYSLVHLAWKFSQIKRDVKVYCIFDAHQISGDDTELLSYLIRQVGLPQILTFYTANTQETFLTDLNSRHRFEWILLNHEKGEGDINNIKMLESLSLIHPGVSVLRINDFSSDDQIENYLLSAPVYRRIYSSKFGHSKYIGRWNLLYDVVQNSEPPLYRCVDFLS